MIQEFTYKGLTLGYKVYENQADKSTETFLAFPGFGRPLQDFEIFEQLLKPGQRIVSIGLFGHDESDFPQERIPHRPLKMDEFRELISAFLAELSVVRFSLLGYSLGGKICLRLIELFPEEIDNLILVAPDGVKRNKIYMFASGTWLGRSIYMGIINNPRPLLVTTDFLRSLRLIPKKLHKFVFYHMETREKREQVGSVWAIYRKFIPSIPNVQNIINSKGIHTVLIYGRYDYVIKSRQGEKLNSRLERDSLHILDNGHLLLERNTILYLRAQNLWP